MTKLLCIDGKFSSNNVRMWFPVEGDTYHISMVDNQNRITLTEDTDIDVPGSEWWEGATGHHTVTTLADGRTPFQSNRFVDITGIEESAEVSAQEPVEVGLR